MSKESKMALAGGHKYGPVSFLLLAEVDVDGNRPAGNVKLFDMLMFGMLNNCG